MGIGISKALLASGGLQRNITLLISPLSLYSPTSRYYTEGGENSEGTIISGMILQFKLQHNAKLSPQSLLSLILLVAITVYFLSSLRLGDEKYRQGCHGKASRLRSQAVYRSILSKLIDSQSSTVLISLSFCVSLISSATVKAVQSSTKQNGHHMPTHSQKYSNVEAGKKVYKMLLLHEIDF